MTDSFEENSQYQLSIEIGGGAFGKCFLAVETPADNTVEGKVFCVKKVRTSCYFVQVSIKFARYLSQGESMHNAYARLGE